MQELNRRNTETVERTLMDMYNKIYEQEIQVMTLNNTVGSLMVKLGLLEQELMVLKAKAMGSGPTVK